MGTPSGLKLYAVAAVEHAGVESLAGDTTLVHYHDLAAIVEPASYAASKFDKTELERYAAVVGEAFRAAPILPAPPGTTFKSHGTLSHWLELHYFTLTDAMNLVEDHVAAR